MKKNKETENKEKKFPITLIERGTKKKLVLEESVRHKLGNVYQGLCERYGKQVWESWDAPLETLILLILSQHTSDINSGRAFASLKERFGTMENVRLGEVEDIAEAIKMGGLARVKGPRIKAVLNQIFAECGSLDLSFLKDLPLEGAKEWLTHLDGVGPKSAACVLLFSLGRPALPVDTHVYRVCQRLGLINKRINEAQAHEVLENALQPEQIYTFHVDLILHGRRTCKAQKPLCAECNLRPLCDYYQEKLV